MPTPVVDSLRNLLHGAICPPPPPSPFLAAFPTRMTLPPHQD